MAEFGRKIEVYLSTSRLALRMASLLRDSPRKGRIFPFVFFWGGLFFLLLFVS